MSASTRWSTALLAAVASMGAAGCNSISGIGQFDFLGDSGAGAGGSGATASASSSSAGGSGGAGGIGEESCLADVPDPTAASLMALVAKSKPVATGYKNDYDQAKGLSVLELGDAYLWEAGLTIDCDGKATPPCSEVMPAPEPQTALQSSKGEPLDPVNLPFVVLPESNCGPFDFKAHGVKPGSVMAVVNEENKRVEYGVAGDTGNCETLGSTSYLMADRLGIDPDPTTGGRAGKVLYIAFKGPCATIVKPEDHKEAEHRGEGLAARLIKTAK